MEKILIIDDSILQVQILRGMLEKDYILEVCHDGLKGIQIAAEFQPSLILLDVVMPKVDGFEVLVRLKEQEQTKYIPIIFITSLSDLGNEEKGLTLGAVDYITKPFRPGIVRARVKTHTELFAYRRTIENLAMLDSLTNLPNRRSYEDRSVSEWGRAMRDQRPLSIAILDVDFFKQYNDNYGHPAGDRVLRQVADTVQARLRRAGDFAARYGGEEFILLMPNTPGEQGLRIAQELCMAIEDLQILHKTSLVSGFVTVSIGGTTVTPQKGNKFEDFVIEADAMLYKAKNSGRNRALWMNQS